MAKPKPAPRRFSEQEVRELMVPPQSAPPSAVEEPKPIAGPPVVLPPSGAEQLAKLPPGSVRHEGDPGDASPWRPPQKRLRLVEYGGREATFETGDDPVYIHIQWTTRDTPTPWIAEPVDSRYTLTGLESLTLEDVLDEPA